MSIEALSLIDAILDTTAIPNLYCLQTVTSSKGASALNKAILSGRTGPLYILLQVNTSGEESKSGLSALKVSDDVEISELGQVAKFIVQECPNLQLQGLMTIGALEASLSAAEGEENPDFDRLKETRTVLEEYLRRVSNPALARWGASGRLRLSMGMSSDFEAALKAGSDVVRVGTGIFGARSVKQSS